MKIQNQHYASLKLNFRLSLFISLLLYSPWTYPVELAKNQFNRHFEYRQAAIFTHLNWSESIVEKIKVNLTAIINFSGIPMEARDENPEYFNYGKLPQVMNNIYRDAFIASRYFLPATHSADYQIELIIDRYQLPFNYASDDQWWNKLHAQTDRWLLTPVNAGIKLTIKLTSGKKKIKQWMDSVEMVLSNCDLNAKPQPQTWLNNQDEISQHYLSTTPGQTFLAATNFLILKVIERLNQQAYLGRVERISGNELYLTSGSTNFTQGEQLDLYYNDPKQGKSEVRAGQIKVIKATENHAIAYPITLRADHIKVGDWVEIAQPSKFNQPDSIYVEKNHCAEVITSSAI